MGEKPIIFNTEMIKAILEGRKTQTRRTVNPQPKDGVRKSPFYPSGLEDLHGYQIKPRYKVGDILYVREAWNKSEDWGEYPDDEEDGEKIYYKADFPEDIWEEEKWRPSIHMPKEAARIFLKVTNLRIEKLQDITIKDAKSEGVICTCPENEENRCYKGNIGHFKELWDSIFANTQKEWNRNPWVEVYEMVERSGE